MEGAERVDFGLSLFPRGERRRRATGVAQGVAYWATTNRASRRMPVCTFMPPLDLQGPEANFAMGWIGELYAIDERAGDDAERAASTTSRLRSSTATMLSASLSSVSRPSATPYGRSKEAVEDGNLVSPSP